MTVKLLHNPQYPTEIDALCNAPLLLTRVLPPLNKHMKGSLFLSVLQMSITSSTDY